MRKSAMFTQKVIQDLNTSYNLTAIYLLFFWRNMGNQQSLPKYHKDLDHQSLACFLKELKQFTYRTGTYIRSASNGEKLTIFQKNQQQNSFDNNNQSFYCLNTQNLSVHKSFIDHQSLKNHINYYNKRVQLTRSVNKSVESFQSCLINLIHFQIIDFSTKQRIFPRPKRKNSARQQQNSKLLKLPTCTFNNIFSSSAGTLNPSNISNPKKQLFSFSFLHEFIPNCIQKQIKSRLQNNQFFREKQVWSIIYCCCEAAKIMVSHGLKQPMLSPNSIFISKDCQIKVAEWELINYYEACQNLDMIQSIFLEDGETFVSTDLELTINHAKNTQKFDILTKYYWPPEGISYLHNTLNIGQVFEDKLQSEPKNGQVFCLGMTILNMLTLQSYYRKSSYSDKQLHKIVQEAIQTRYQINQPISSELIELLFKMLEWDPSQRLNFQQVTEHIHAAFEKNQQIFYQIQSLQGTGRSSKICLDQRISRSKLQDNNLSGNCKQQPTSKSITTHFNSTPYPHPPSNLSIQTVTRPQSPNQSLPNPYKNKTHRQQQLNGSGAIFQGPGDDYDPDALQHDGGQACRYTSMGTDRQPRLSVILKLQRDSQDRPDCSRLSHWLGEQVQTPDFDVDFQPDSDSGNLWSAGQSRGEVAASQDDQRQQSRQLFIDNDRFEVVDYVPLDWNQTIIKKKSVQNQLQDRFLPLNNISFNEIQKKNQFYSQISYDYLKRNMGLSDQSMKFKSQQNYQSSRQHCGNLQRSVKEGESSILSKGSQNKQNRFEPQKLNSQILSSPNLSNTQMLFTSPDLLAVIRQFTKKDSQLTANSKCSTMPIEKIRAPHNQSLFLQQKPFDSCYMANPLNATSSPCLPPSHPAPSSFTTQQFSKGRFQGSKKNDLRNGYGTFYYKEGGKYSGYWYQDKMDGHGTLYYPDGRVAYEGQWRNDELHGKGRLNNENPKVLEGGYRFQSFGESEEEESWVAYDGWFQNDQKAGWGELTLSNGEKYVGEFRNDMVHGKGKFYRNNGDVFQGYWQNNQLSHY